MLEFELATPYHSIVMSVVRSTFIHLADAFIRSDLQLLYVSEVARLWRN